MRAVYAVLGLVAAAWLGLYLSPVGSWYTASQSRWWSACTETSREHDHRDPAPTYLTAIGFRPVDYPLASRKVCPRLSAFGQ
jgi:hypothetical protein